MASTQLSILRKRKTRKRPRTTSGEEKHPGGIHRQLAVGWLLWSVVLFLFYAGGQIGHTELTEGQRARNTIVATVGFSCPDMPRTELLRQQTADEILPVFAIDYAGLHTATRSLGRLFERIEALRLPVDPPPSPEELQSSVTDALFLLGLPITAEDAQALIPAGQEKTVLAAHRTALEGVWSRGIVSRREKDTRFDGFASRGQVSILSEDGVLGRPVAMDDLLLDTDATDQAVAAVLAALPELDIPSLPLATVLRQWLIPNLRYDAGSTDELRAEAVKQIAVVHQEITPGATIVGTGERITPQVMATILAHEQKRAQMESPQDRIMDRVGHGALLLLGLIIVCGLLRIMEPGLLYDVRALCLMSVVSLLTIVPAKLMLVASSTSTLLPHALLEPLVPLALAPLLSAILIGGPAAVGVGMWSSFAVSLMFGHSFFMFLLGLVVTLVAASAARATRRRSHLFRIGFSIGLASLATVLCIGALNQQVFDVLGPQLITALVGGLLCALAAAMLIPVFEWGFRVTTDLTLLEMSDMGHPLLRRLAIEAPGTYHHSLMVANLAQSAAVEIEANGLLTRVCAYFHDIGKMTKPEFFVENSQYTQNPHDDLSPNMSALVLISHVKEGLALAQRHKLPPPILDGIAQHHGTGLIYYFYHRALTQQEKNGESGGGRPIDETDFRYPGPRPQSREMGILLLADSVEAASRSMEKPSVSRIEALVNEICDARLQDGQLDECDLTFRQLAAIKRSFIFTLTNMLHGRVKYPKHENRDQQPAKPVSDKRQEAGTPQPVAHGTG